MSNDTSVVGITESSEEKLWFPIGAYVGCICLYCSMGAAMFIHWEAQWSFVHAFHFGFNLIVTVGLGDLVVRDYLFLSLIVAFVIIGIYLTYILHKVLPQKIKSMPMQGRSNVSCFISMFSYCTRFSTE